MSEEELKQTGGDGYTFNMGENVGGLPAVEGYNCCDGAAPPTAPADATNQVGGKQTEDSKKEEAAIKAEAEAEAAEEAAIEAARETREKGKQEVMHSREAVAVAEAEKNDPRKFEYTGASGGAINPFNFIINPETGVRMSLFSSGGKALLKNLIKLYKTGGAPKTGGEPAELPGAFGEDYFNTEADALKGEW